MWEILAFNLVANLEPSKRFLALFAKIGANCPYLPISIVSFELSLSQIVNWFMTLPFTYQRGRANWLHVVDFKESLQYCGVVKERRVSHLANHAVFTCKPWCHQICNYNDGLTWRFIDENDIKELRNIWQIRYTRS